MSRPRTVKTRAQPVASPAMSEVLLEKPGANFFGFETIDTDGKKRRDAAVVRGNGSLTLTAGELRFVRSAPPVEIVVPVEQIKWLKIVKAHNGKSFGFLPILQVAVPTPTEMRVLGICVGRQSDTQEWVDAIEKLLASRSVP